MLNPAFCLLPGGSAHLSKRLKLLETKDPRELPDYVGWFSFFLESLPDDSPATPTPHPLPAAITLSSVPLVQIRQDGWVGTLSGMTRPAATASTYLADAQQHISLFHERYGLIFGGGNSKWDYAFSTFFRRGDGACLATGYEALLAEDGRASIILQYREDRLRLSLRLESPSQARVEAAWLTPRPDDQWEVAFAVPSPPGTEWLFPDTPGPATPSLLISPEENPVCVGPHRRLNRGLVESEKPGWVTLNRQVRLELSAGRAVNLRWPFVRYTPYVVYPHEDLHLAATRLSAVLDRTRPAISIRVRMVV